MSGRIRTTNLVLLTIEGFLYLNKIICPILSLDFSTTVKYDPPDEISNNNLEECDAEIIGGDVVEEFSSGEISSSGSGGGQNFG